MGSAPWATTVNLVILYGPLWQVWLYVMGHCSEFGYTLWATAANLVFSYGPLRLIWLCIMVHCGEFGYGLWTSASGPTVKICDDFRAMGHRPGFSYAL
jgi:hypothetical protein